MLVDLDGDGEKVSVYKKKGRIFEKVYEYPEDAEFTLTIYGGDLCGKLVFVVGHRKGKRNFFAITCDENDKYGFEMIDEIAMYHLSKEGKSCI